MSLFNLFFPHMQELDGFFNNSRTIHLRGTACLMCSNPSIHLEKEAVHFQGRSPQILCNGNGLFSEFSLQLVLPLY
ncbi:hypothetical protein A8L34_02320 [Bacillus sp. FJAT-27264]|nr:hypothetical protein A8L34_02320 [Bacillus sp. FJAT-27264]